MTVATPVEVVGALLDGVPRLVMGDHAQVERLAALYAETTWVTHPMSTDTPPLTTRDELRRHFTTVGERVGDVTLWAVEDLTVHETTDPEVVISEFRYAYVRDGERRAFPCVFVTTVRDGLVVEAHDYAVRR